MIRYFLLCLAVLSLAAWPVLAENKIFLTPNQSGSGKNKSAPRIYVPQDTDSYSHPGRKTPNPFLRTKSQPKKDPFAIFRESVKGLDTKYMRQAGQPPQNARDLTMLVAAHSIPSLTAVLKHQRELGKTLSAKAAEFNAQAESMKAKKPPMSKLARGILEDAQAMNAIPSSPTQTKLGPLIFPSSPQAMAAGEKEKPKKKVSSSAVYNPPPTLTTPPKVFRGYR